MKLGSLTFKDNYGKTYPFGVYSKNTRFKAVVAIYAFLTTYSISGKRPISAHDLTIITSGTRPPDLGSRR